MQERQLSIDARIVSTSSAGKNRGVKIVNLDRPRGLAVFVHATAEGQGEGARSGNLEVCKMQVEWEKEGEDVWSNGGEGKSQGQAGREEMVRME